MKYFIIVLSLFVCSCAPASKLQHTDLNMPDKYVFTSDTLPLSCVNVWWKNLNDPILDSLEQVALRQNRSIKTAIINIDKASLLTANTKAQALPSLSLSAKASVSYDYQTKVTQQYSLMPAISWEIDLWGKIKKQAEASVASFHATEYQAAAVIQNLTASVAQAYFTAVYNRESMIIAKQTYDSRKVAEQLMDSMYHYGIISKVDLSQAQASTATAGAAIEQYNRAYNQAILALNVLTGETPHSIELYKAIDTIPIIHPGLPSSLLERRPDVMEAYYGLQQANAMVGVAIASRLPSISITGDGGLAVSIVRDIATAKPIAWSGAASILAPILNWGTLKRNVKIAQIDAQTALYGYQDAMLNALSEVEQSLVAISTLKNEINQNKTIVKSSQQAKELTTELYLSGGSSYLDLLDTDRTYLSAQLQYLQSTNALVNAYITLCKALGGGWDL